MFTTVYALKSTANQSFEWFLTFRILESQHFCYISNTKLLSLVFEVCIKTFSKLFQSKLPPKHPINVLCHERVIINPIYIPGKHKTWCLLGYWHARETQDLRWLLTQRHFRFRKCLNSSRPLLVGVVLNWRFRVNRILLMMDQIRGQAAHGNMGCQVLKKGMQN